ncbi:hypothetical protein L6R52_44260, partial [Myxococcota bacterium]|nr:hypothetical protein [Myxococcota bacterium]
LGPRAASAAPYEDTRRRFSLELPSGWGLAPQFGDTSGMVFQKKVVARRATTLAILVVRLDDYAATDVTDYANKMEAELKGLPGYKRIAERSALVGGKPALVRELRVLASKEPKIEKTIVAHFVEASGHHYMLHFESTSADLHRFQDDLAAILASFRPQLVASAPREPIGRAELDPRGPAPNLAGRWMNDDGLVLVLGGDGSFALAEASGRYEIKDGALTLIIPGQGRESFTFTHDDVAGTLTLASANLGDPMVYRRIKGGAPTPPPRTEPKKSAPGLPPAIAELVARWTTPTPSGPLVMELRGDRTFTMGKMVGQWDATLDRLTLTRGGEELVSYRYRWSGDQLALTGGDLEEEVVFQRQPRE